MRVHWALVQIKGDDDSAEIIAELQNEWFRNRSRTTDRASNFDGYAPVDSWDWEKTHGTINPDQKVRVLTHKSKTLHPYHTTAGHSNSKYTPYYWHINRYFKVEGPVHIAL